MHNLDGRAGVKGMRLSIDPLGKSRVEVEDEGSEGRQRNMEEEVEEERVKWGGDA